MIIPCKTVRLKDDFSLAGGDFGFFLLDVIEFDLATGRRHQQKLGRCGGARLADLEKAEPVATLEVGQGHRMAGLDPEARFLCSAAPKRS